MHVSFKMGISFVLIVLSVSTVCQSDTPRKCGPRNVCQCTRVNQTDVKVDCKDTEINRSEACDICTQVDNVTSLDLSETNLEELPDKCFCDCIELRDLSLSRNGLTALEDNTFCALKELKILDLSRNQLIKQGSFSGKDVFRRLIGLKVLYLQGNIDSNENSSSEYFLGSLPKDSFPSLKELFIDGVKNIQFDSNFKHFVHLENLIFSGIGAICNIVNLTNTSFVNVPNLRNLNLANCSISGIEPGTFEVLHNLTHLNLSTNRGLGLVTLPDVFYGLQSTNIKLLDYSRVIKTFGLYYELLRCNLLYANNTNLEELYMNANNIIYVETNALHMFPKTLKVVLATENWFSFKPYWLQTGCLSNLKRLEIGRKDYSPNPTQFNKETKISEKRNLLPGGCQIPRPSKIDSNCPYFEDNETLHFSKISFPINLEFLSFKGSAINPDIKEKVKFRNWKNNLKSLDLSDNLIGNILNKFFLRLSKLESLNISNNYISIISNEPARMVPNIQSLDASKNYFGMFLTDEFDDLFSPMPFLKHLNLSQNGIRRLPKNVFAAQKNLTELCLSFNSLSDFNVAFENNKNLSKLDLRQNKIVSLATELLDQMSKTENVSIDVSNNSLAISCDNIKFLRWILTHPKYFRNVDSYTYDNKGKHSIISTKDLARIVNNLEENCKTTDYTILIIVLSLLILIFIILVIIGIMFRFRWRIQFLYYMAKAQSRGYRRCPEMRDEFYYDAFVSYAEEDDPFVKSELVDELEQKSGFSLCIHQRDFIAGHYIAENILRAIKNSRTTILVLSNNFLESKWCIYEFNMARMESIYTRHGDKVILCIKYKGIDIAQMSAEMVDYLDSQTFLEYPDDESQKPYFWELLSKALHDEISTTG